MNLVKSIVICSLTSLLAGSAAFAADAPPKVPTSPTPPVKIRHYLPNSLQVNVTDHGMLLLQNNLDTIMNNMGISFNEAYFADLKWQSAISYKLDDVNVDPDAKKLILTIRDTLKSWFAGFPLGDVKPAVEIGNSGYQAVFNKFSITADENLLHQLKKTGGAVLILDIDIKEIDLSASKVRAWDLNSPILGQVGFDNPRIKVGGGAVPLQLRLPFYVNIDSQGLPIFEVLGLDENFDKIDVSISYDKLVIPQIELTVNGVAYPFNSANLESTLTQNEPTIIASLRSYLHTFAGEQLPALLNQQAKLYLVKDLEEVNTLEAPGVDANSTAQFLWGLQLKDINEDDGISVKLNTFVEDPANPNSVPKASASTTTPAQINSLNKADYDVGLAINEGMINRMLQLSFEKKLFSHIVIGGGTPDPKCTKDVPTFNGAGQFLKITEVPLLKPANMPSLPKPALGETFVRISLSIQVPKGTVSDIQQWALDDAFVVGVDVIAKVAKSADGKAMQILLWDIDPDSVSLDSDYLTVIGKLFKGEVMSQMKSTFAILAQSWRCENFTLPGSIPVPVLFGVDLSIKHLVMEPTGNLVLYMDYADLGATAGATK